VTTVSPEGWAQIKSYLRPGEKAVIVTRRHWIVLLKPVAGLAAAALIATWVADSVGDSLPLLVDVVLLATTAVLGWLLWEVLEYRREWFVVTDKRVLLFHGLITHKVAIMPIKKVTDLSYNVPLLGRVLGYGEFVFESAGQDQALNRVSHLGRSKVLYAVLTDQLLTKSGADDGT
jgi:membrane protein YdbS with pleckstrin-like domain